MNQIIELPGRAERAATDASVLLDCRNLSRTFIVGGSLFSKAKELRAVDRVNVSVRRGEVLAIVGESGSGKTTLGRMMLGILPPTSGEMLLDGKPVSGIDRKTLARRIQPIFQDPYSSLNPRKTVAQIIGLPLAVHGIEAGAARDRRVEEIMERVGLSRRLIHSYPNQLSGGQRQRVAIARALVVQPEIVVCDEPTSALDVSVQAQILNLLVDLRNEFNLTYIFISHDLGVVEYIADQLAVMYMGQVVEAGPRHEVLEQRRHPYTQALLGSVLTPDPSLGLPDLQIGRGFPDIMHPPSGCHFHPRCPSAMPVCSAVEPPAFRDSAGLVHCHLFSGEGSSATRPIAQ
ncbi:MAG: ATP-binding cassette protein [Rhodospirillales bacterium]|nr:ATP-binding cassette protein [Rhodospirillales bacterium]